MHVRVSVHSGRPGRSRRRRKSISDGRLTYCVHTARVQVVSGQCTICTRSDGVYIRIICCCIRRVASAESVAHILETVYTLWT